MTKERPLGDAPSLVQSLGEWDSFPRDSYDPSGPVTMTLPFMSCGWKEQS
jgi:hypothetical protein